MCIMAKPNRAASTTIKDEPGITPKSAWDYLKMKDYEKTSLSIDELEHDCVRIHGVELYDGIDDKEFTVMEVSYILNEGVDENLNKERFSLRTGAAMIVKLSRDIKAARAANVKLGSVPIRILKKGRAWAFEPVEDSNPPVEPLKQQEIPF